MHCFITQNVLTVWNYLERSIIIDLRSVCSCALQCGQIYGFWIDLCLRFTSVAV